MTEAKPGRARRWTAWIVTIVAVLGLALSVPVLWLHDTVLTTDGYVAVVDQLPSDPAFSEAVGTAAAARIVDRLNLGDRLRELLPDAVDPLITTVVVGIEDRMRERLTALVSDPRFSTAWVAINTAFHRELLELLRGDPGVVALQGGAITIDLTALIGGALRMLQEVGIVPPDVALSDNPDSSAARAVLDALRARGWAIPEDLTAIPLFDAPNLGLLQQVVRSFDVIAVVLPILSIALAILAIYLSRRTARSLVLFAASIVAGVGLTLLAVVAVGDTIVTRARPVGAAMVNSLFGALTDSLVRWTVAALFVSALLLLLAWAFARRECQASARAGALKGTVDPRAPRGLTGPQPGRQPCYEDPAGAAAGARRRERSRRST